MMNLKHNISQLIIEKNLKGVGSKKPDFSSWGGQGTDLTGNGTGHVYVRSVKCLITVLVALLM